MRGTADVREFLDHGWRAFPDLTFELAAGPTHNERRPPRRLLVKTTATHQGPLDPPGIPATGTHIEFDGVDIHEYRDGKIATADHHQHDDIALQEGLLPAPGSKAERVMTGLQKLRSRLTRSRTSST
ncbi:ester cyclase [Rhodococcus opacus]|uniref:Uncharacterized protein n=1 Tax=Rhodococcus opacus (strain B4) TaxID=632772 RepID=C1ASD3_RHOOB|nr:ester cyclase [Rhodococcus opacus]BAH48382.1 hypothetical protein ROP_01350 [Rhodococcus opacus B4]